MGEVNFKNQSKIGNINEIAQTNMGTKHFHQKRF